LATIIEALLFSLTLIPDPSPLKGRRVVTAGFCRPARNLSTDERRPIENVLVAESKDKVAVRPEICVSNRVLTLLEIMDETVGFDDEAKLVATKVYDIGPDCFLPSEFQAA
jgi:hypothetical protein